MDDYIREEITRRIFIHGSPHVQIPYASKALILNKVVSQRIILKRKSIFYPLFLERIILELILNKGKLVFDKERDILSPKSRDYLSYNQGEIRI